MFHTFFHVDFLNVLHVLFFQMQNFIAQISVFTCKFFTWSHGHITPYYYYIITHDVT